MTFRVLIELIKFFLMKVKKCQIVLRSIISFNFMLKLTILLVKMKIDSRADILCMK